MELASLTVDATGPNGEKVGIRADADLALRRGAYANVASVTIRPKEDIIDFFFIDGREDDGTMTGSHVSRVVLSHESLMELYRAIGSRLGVDAAGGDNAR